MPSHNLVNFKSQKKVYLKSNIASNGFPNFVHFRKRDMKQVFSTLEKIKNWSRDIEVFLKFEVFKPSIIVNRNILKNIFSKVIKDPFIWKEICKMIETGNVKALNNFSDLACFSNDLNFLSYLLFEVYLSEIDFYILNLCSFFNTNYSLSKEFFYSKLYNDRSKFPLVPLMLDKSFSRSFNLFTSEARSNYNCNFVFDKHIYYARYLNSFLFGFIGSKTFLSKLKYKIISFLKGNLYLDIKKFSFLYLFDNEVCFCGYNITLVSLYGYDNFKNNIYLKKRDYLKKKLFSRLVSYKLNVSKLLLTRTYYEFFFQIKEFLGSCAKISLLNCYKSFWLSILSYEVRKTLFNTEFNILLKSSFFVSNGSFRNYFFDSYIFKVKKLVSKLGFVESTLFSSFVPLDLSFHLLIKEFNSNSSLLYYSLFDLIESRNVFLRSYFFENKSVLSGFLFTEFELLLLAKNFSRIRGLNLKKSYAFRLLIPLQLVISKLRSLGFCHTFINRPIGNVNFFQFDDIEIINTFSYFCHIFLIWYNKAFNFYKINLILDFINKSCCLTISRKHRKPRYWPYIIYANKFSVLSSIYIFSSNFGYIRAKNSFIDENFFLEL